VQRAGEPIDIALPHLVPADGGPVRRIDLGEMRDHFVRLVGWLPDASAVVLLRLSRALDRAELFLVDAADGRARRVLREQCATFLRLDSIIWLGPTGCELLPGRRFLWQSEREGWNHLYLGELDADPNAPLLQLTRGAMVVQDIVRFDSERVWFRACEGGPRPYDLHLYCVPLAGGPVQRLSAGDGEHEAVFSPDGSHFVDTFSTPAVAPRSVLRRADGSRLAELDLTDLSPLLGPGWTAPEEIVVTAADGKTPLHGVLFRPPGFDPARRYPLLHWVYGGPQMRVAPRRLRRAATPTSFTARSRMRATWFWCWMHAARRSGPKPSRTWSGAALSTTSSPTRPARCVNCWPGTPGSTRSAWACSAAPGAQASPCTCWRRPPTCTAPPPARCRASTRMAA
jgi:hypothetical protein